MAMKMREVENGTFSSGIWVGSLSWSSLVLGYYYIDTPEKHPSCNLGPRYGRCSIGYVSQCTARRNIFAIEYFEHLGSVKFLGRSLYNCRTKTGAARSPFVK